MDLRSISLCAGVGGLDLGLRIADPGIRTVCYVEREAFSAAVLAARMADEALDDAPVWSDVTTFDGRPWRGKVDLIAAGFPCQPVSLAGKRAGLDDHRFIWDDIARIVGEVEPRYVFLENVPGILTADGGAFLDRVLSSLVVLGFDCEWDLFSAEETGAPHKRQRWFCLAYSRSTRRQQDPRSTHGDEAPDEGRTTEHHHVSAGSRPALADPRHGLVPVAGRGPEGRDGAGPAGATLVNANGAGREEHGGSVAVRAEQPPTERPVGPVGHAEGGTRLGPTPGRGGHPAQPDQDGRHVVDSPVLSEREPINGIQPVAPERDARSESGSGRSGVRQVADAEGTERELAGDTRERGAGLANGRVYPPARNDRAGWASVEASLEPAVCRDADGLAAGLDPALFAYRQDRLRAVGNGVVPLTAAVAWIELNRRMADHA